uniref:Uncharacterized protein n=1 Tax=candidate division WOR-3 bacterium TaxID=2052148 RepID=A0A7C4YGH2_UNCW3
MLLILSFYPSFFENGLLKYIERMEEKYLPEYFGFDRDFYKVSLNKGGIYGRMDTLKRVSLGDIIIIKENNYAIFFFPIVSAGDGGIYPKKKWKGRLYGAIYDGGIFYENKKFLLILGNTHIKYTTAPLNSPILSNDIPPMPLLFYNFRIWKMNISHLVSNLGFYKGTKFDPSLNPFDSVNLHRYLLINRYEFNFKKFGLGLTEIGILGKEGMDFYLLNPVGIMYEYQFNFGENINIMWNFDIHLLLQNFYFYSNIFIDDFQYEYDPWNEPNHIGLNIGFLNKIKGNFFWNVEYNIFSRWVYGHFLVYQRYIYDGFNLGIDNGSDFDELSGRIIYKNKKDDYFYITMKFRRKGETNPDTPWPVTYEDGDTSKFPDNNFLSGNVKKRYVLSFDMKRSFKGFFITSGFGIIYEDKIYPLLNIGILSEIKFKNRRDYE